VIGSGAFGQVAKGEVRNINGIKGQTLTVAIKMPKGRLEASLLAFNTNVVFFLILKNNIHNDHYG